MKMIKRVMAGMIMATLMLASVLSVSAADSKGREIYPTGSSKGHYQITDDAKKFEGVSQEVLGQIDDVDDNKFTSLPTDIQSKISGKTIIWKTVDLDAVGEHSGCVPHHTITLGIDGLSKNCSEVVVLHYSQARSTWEVLTPSNVNYDAKTITVAIKDLSPVAVLAKVTGSAGTGSSPATEGPSFGWMLWAAAAFVVVGTGIVVSQKKNRQ